MNQTSMKTSILNTNKKKTTQKIVFFFLLLTVDIVNINISFSETVHKKTEIYKWVDNDGRTHYAARPENKSAQKMNFASKTFHDTKNSRQDAQTKKRKQLCTDAKATMKKYKGAPFLFRYDEDSHEKIRMTKSETKSAFLQAEKDVSYWCNPLPSDKK